MKYSTINYDSNRPIPNVVKAPLNSDIGVAIKVWKDGQLLDADLSVDGLSATSTRNGWQLFDLSTGSDQGRKEYSVVGEQEATIDFQDGELFTFSNATSRRRTMNLNLCALSATEISGRTLYAKDIKKLEIQATLSAGEQSPQSGISSFVVTPDKDFGVLSGNSNPTIVWPESDGWYILALNEPMYLADHIELDEYSTLRFRATLPAYSDISCDWSIKVDSGDGFRDSFGLTVVGENENTIEVK